MSSRVRKKSSRRSLSLDDVVAKAVLLEVRCHELSARFTEHAPPPGDISLRPDFSVDTGTAPPEPGHFVVAARVELTGVVKIASDGEEHEVPIVKAHTLYLLRYGLPDQITLDAELATSFANTTGLFNAWPFLREALHDATRRLGLVPFTLPLLRLGPPAKK